MTLPEIIDIDEEGLIDKEFVGDECPDCGIVFPTDEEFLSHICTIE